VLLAAIPIITVVRFVTQGYAMVKGVGEVSAFKRTNSLSAIGAAYLKAYVNMFQKLPAMLAKRKGLSKKHYIGNLGMLSLIWKFRLSIGEITGMKMK
jgi:hypothetical protein